MKALSEWQKLRVRDALRAYRLYTRKDDDSDYFNWKDVREAILLQTGVEIGAHSRAGGERLRQFVEGTPDKEGNLKYPSPQPEALEAVIEFVTDPDLALLSPEELEEYVPPWQAPLRLLEYLDDGTDIAGEIPIEKLQGTYRYIESRDEQAVINEITLERGLENGLIQVAEVEEFYPADIAASLSSLMPDERRSHRVARVQHGGWAVLTPEDSLLFYLKHKGSLRNRYYATVAAKTTLWEVDEPYDLLALIRQDFPLELMATEELDATAVRGQSLEDIDQRLMVFEKV
jgi:hypothetical protein